MYCFSISYESPRGRSLYSQIAVVQNWAVLRPTIYYADRLCCVLGQGGAWSGEGEWVAFKLRTDPGTKIREDVDYFIYLICLYSVRWDVYSCATAVSSWPNGLIIIIIIIYSHPAVLQNWPVLRPTIMLIVLYSVCWDVYAAAAAAVKLGTQGAGVTGMSSSFLRSGPSVHGGLYLASMLLPVILCPSPFKTSRSSASCFVTSATDAHPENVTHATVPQCTDVRLTESSFGAGVFVGSLYDDGSTNDIFILPAVSSAPPVPVIDGPRPVTTGAVMLMVSCVEFSALPKTPMYRASRLKLLFPPTMSSVVVETITNGAYLRIS
mmetsp:Transcript_30571/g.51500  ORF Transcript_30571/g.51500 Transcript_30571/m.51500 type:complete len:322 (+) Transcript_30571:1-966(+)